MPLSVRLGANTCGRTAHRRNRVERDAAAGRRTGHHRGVTRAPTTSPPFRDRLAEGWLSLAWGVLTVAGLLLGFAVIAAYSSYHDLLAESGGDDSLAPSGLVISAAVALPAVIPLAFAGLSFRRRWEPTARKTLVCLGAALLFIEVVMIAYASAGSG